jgi:hypothetical protein
MTSKDLRHLFDQARITTDKCDPRAGLSCNLLVIDDWCRIVLPNQATERLLLLRRQ